MLLREARRRSGLTIRQLARRARTSHSAVAAYESGAKSPNSATIRRLVEACGFEIEQRLRPIAPFENRAQRGAIGRAVAARRLDLRVGDFPVAVDRESDLRGEIAGDLRPEPVRADETVHVRQIHGVREIATFECSDTRGARGDAIAGTILSSFV